MAYFSVEMCSGMCSMCTSLHELTLQIQAEVRSRKKTTGQSGAEQSAFKHLICRKRCLRVRKGCAAEFHSAEEITLI